MRVIGVICAMDSEIDGVRKGLEVNGSSAGIEEGIYTFKLYDFHGLRLVTVCSGIGKVNASAAAQQLISRFGAEIVVNPGVAGGMDTKVGVCDVVISSDVAHHDFDPQILLDYPPYASSFKADERLIKLAEESCKRVGMKSFVGRIVSGEQFIADAAVKADIKARLDPLAVDMESSAVGHCAYVNKVPYVTLRCISDNANDEAGISFDEFKIIASEKIGVLALDFFASLA